GYAARAFYDSQISHKCRQIAEVIEDSSIAIVSPIICVWREAAIQDVDLRNEPCCSPSACEQSVDWRALSQRLRNRAARDPAGEDRNGAAHRGRNTGRLLYRPSLLQTRLQILGICPTSGAALDHSATRDAERKTKARSGPRTPRIWERQ